MSEFLSKDDFHEYVLDNRDRQDANKKEIIDTLSKNLGSRVTKLEDENTKQNRFAAAVTALNVAILGLLAYLK